jgi:uncharacterized protein YndB with AHSA1/START domain
VNKYCPPIEVYNRIVIRAQPERVWNLLADVAKWPSWYRDCRWVRMESGPAASFRWKAHHVVLRSKVIAAERPYRFAIVADAPGLHAGRTFALYPSADGLSTFVVSHETYIGLVARLGRRFLARRLRAANQAMIRDLARAQSRNRLPNVAASRGRT